MQIDIISIFPEYFAPLDISLIGKAQESAVINVQKHNLRDWTEDVHHSVDDTPYGGGQGMLMRADIWGKALDAVNSLGAVIIVPSPTGEVFHQDMAAELAEKEHLIFACARYEGIDQRVMDFYAPQMREVSLGDYVVFGGEVAALVMLEAIIRLMPGVIGNEQSHQDDSFQAGLLEGPKYTRPLEWRGLTVPEILLSGHHAQIAAWNEEQAQSRTRTRRPDLLAE